MDTLFLVIPALLAYGFIMIMFLNQAKPGSSILFGITLPSHALTAPSIEKLQAEYKKTYIVYGIVSLASIAPLLLLTKYTSMALIYLFVWFTAFIYTSKLPFHKFHRLTAALKRENDWFVGAKRILRIDTKLNLLKKSKTVSPYWFLIPALISLSLLLSSISNENPLLTVTGCSSIFMTAVLFTIYSAFRKMKPKFYGDNPDINAAINRTAGRYWSILWLFMAIFESLNAIVTYSILTGDSSSDLTLWMIGIVMVSLVPLAAILFVHTRVRALEEKLAQTDGESVPVDDDEYWINGMTYYNPNDKAVLVPKRFGIGSTLNMATQAGKWIQYGGIALAVAIIVPLSAFAVQSEQTSPTLQISEDNIVAISYPMYGYSFPVSEIVELTLKDTLPSGFRTNGVATSRYARGSFSLEELGSSKLYVYKNSPPYICIKLDGLYVIFNEQDTAQTKAVYDQLLDRWNKEKA